MTIQTGASSSPVWLIMLPYAFLGILQFVVLVVLVELRHRRVMGEGTKTWNEILELRNRLSRSMDDLNKRIDSITFTVSSEMDTGGDDPYLPGSSELPPSAAIPQPAAIPPPEEPRQWYPPGPPRPLGHIINPRSDRSDRLEPPVQGPPAQPGTPPETPEALGQRFLQALRQANWDYTAAWEQFASELRTRYAEHDLWYDLKAPGLELLDRKKDSGWWEATFCRVLVLRGPRGYQGMVFDSHVRERSPAQEDFRVLEVENHSHGPLNRENLIAYVPATVSKDAGGWTLVGYGRVVYQ